METKMGVWIDHRKAVIVDLADEGLQIWTLLSRVGQLRRTGDSMLTGRYEAQEVPEDDSLQAALTGELNSYYYKIILSMRNACAIFICGPGGAKGELQNIIEQGPLSGRIAGIKSAGRMTDRQIVASIVGYFQEEASGSLKNIKEPQALVAMVAAMSPSEHTRVAATE